MTPMFSVTWTVMHHLDEDSPLGGCTPENLVEKSAMVIVTMTGYDATYAQQVHARHIYYPEDIRWNHRYVDVVEAAPGQPLIIDYRYFHDTIPDADASV